MNNTKPIDAAAAETSTVEPSEHIDLRIGGMTCPHCPPAIEKALAAVPGVTSAHVNLASNIARISYEPSRTKLADIVQERRAPKPAHPLLREAELLAHLSGEFRNTARVSGRIRALGVDHLAERRRDFVEILLVNDEAVLLGRKRNHARFEEWRSKRGPEARVTCDPIERGDQIGIEPAPRPPLSFIDRRLSAGMRVEHVHHLSEQRDAGEQRDRIAP